MGADPRLFACDMFGKTVFTRDRAVPDAPLGRRIVTLAVRAVVAAIRNNPFGPAIGVPAISRAESAIYRWRLLCGIAGGGHPDTELVRSTGFR